MRQRARQQGAPEQLYFSVKSIAQRWACSEDKVSRVLETYRGRAGFIDLAIRKKRKRKYSIIRIAPFLLKEIEGDLR